MHFSKILTLLLLVAAVVVIAAFLIFLPLHNRSTGEQPSPHALDQTE
jgi:hypothetical protein